eukprot:scaffold2235_cov201-Skeletonema_marinoi.AAC.1
MTSDSGIDNRARADGGSILDYLGEEAKQSRTNKCEPARSTHIGINSQVPHTIPKIISPTPARDDTKTPSRLWKSSACDSSLGQGR